MSANTYYYDQLNREQKQAYHAIRTGLEALSPAFSVPRLSSQELLDLYFMVRMDHPEIFYTVKFSYRYYPQAASGEMVPEYLFRKKQIQAHQKAMASRIQRIVRPAEKLSDEEKLKYVHDFICQNVRYDKLKKPYSHEIIGPLGQGVSVCEGIAKTVKVLCDHLGIWCIVALCGNNPEKGIKYRHTWNVVKLDGKYYHLDATFDNTLSAPGQIRYDYFNLCDAQIFRDHEPPVWPLPQCTDNSRFYYREKKLSFTKYEEIQKRAAQALRKKKDLLFHWRGGFLTKEVLQELLQLLQAEAEKKGKNACVSLNWPQAVLLVSFCEEAAPERVKLEEANEGELVEAEV